LLSGVLETSAERYKILIMRKIKLFLGFVIFVSVIAVSCTKTQYEKDEEIIKQYIEDHNLNAVELDYTGLYYVIEKPGGSQHPHSNSEVTVNYHGELVDGTVFGKDDTVKLYLPETIMGWQMGVPLIGEGGSIKLLIPSQYGYGTSGSGKVPKNAVLIFDIDLILFN